VRARCEGAPAALMHLGAGAIMRCAKSAMNALCSALWLCGRRARSAAERVLYFMVGQPLSVRRPTIYLVQNSLKRAVGEPQTAQTWRDGEASSFDNTTGSAGCGGPQSQIWISSLWIPSGQERNACISSCLCCLEWRKVRPPAVWKAGRKAHIYREAAPLRADSRVTYGGGLLDVEPRMHEHAAVTVHTVVLLAQPD